MPRTTSSRPTRERIATPFQAASPWTATSYPRALSSSFRSAPNASSVSLVSCRETTSGLRSSSHGSSRGTRCLTELTFQVAIRTRCSLRGRGYLPGMASLQEVLADPQRLAALHATELMDAPAEAGFDRLAALAQRLLGIPIALVSLVDDSRQFFMACVGLGGWAGEERGTGLSHSFCQHVVHAGEPL